MTRPHDEHLEAARDQREEHHRPNLLPDEKTIREQLLALIGELAEGRKVAAAEINDALENYSGHLCPSCGSEHPDLDDFIHGALTRALKALGGKD